MINKMKPLLLTIALLFSTPAWAKMGEVNDKGDIIAGVLMMTLTVAIITLAILNFFSKKLIIPIFVLLALVGSIIYYAKGFQGLMMLTGVLFIGVMLCWTFHDIRKKTGDNPFIGGGGDFGGGGGD